MKHIIENKIVIAGSDRLLHKHKIAHDNCQIDGTVIHLAIDNVYAGYIVIADELKEDARQAIQALKRMGVEKTVMLTGDNQAIASSFLCELCVLCGSFFYDECVSPIQ